MELPQSKSTSKGIERVYETELGLGNTKNMGIRSQYKTNALLVSDVGCYIEMGDSLER